MKLVQIRLWSVGQLLKLKIQLTEKLLSLVQPGDTLWIKGSRGMKMERVLQMFLEEDQ